MWIVVLVPTCSCSTTDATTANVNDVPLIDNSTIDFFDVSRYMGKWFEIARYENRFERGMSHVTATYSQTPEGKIKVLNEGLKKGKLHTSKGRAYLPDPYYFPGQLRVSFFLWFYSDYYILELDQTAYQYAIVGSSSADYLWILYRKPVMPDELLSNLLERLTKRGYDTTRFIFVDQSPITVSN